jgi:hypothetical protein
MSSGYTGSSGLSGSAGISSYGTGSGAGVSSTEANKGSSFVDSIKGTVAQVKEKFHEATRPSAEEQARAERVKM